MQTHSCGHSIERQWPLISTKKEKKERNWVAVCWCRLPLNIKKRPIENEKQRERKNMRVNKCRHHVVICRWSQGRIRFIFQWTHSHLVLHYWPLLNIMQYKMKRKVNIRCWYNVCTRYDLIWTLGITMINQRINQYMWAYDVKQNVLTLCCKDKELSDKVDDILLLIYARRSIDRKI